jgi:enediyne biosynthesis protein E4
MYHNKWVHIKFIVVLLTILSGCSSRQMANAPLFEALDSKRTGIDFSNNLNYNNEFNLFKYIYFYNGSGIGAGDFNNDGLVDLFFGSNQEQNKLYLNTGNLQFKDATQAAAIPQDRGWSTGISVVDINNDGLLDIYVCRVGNYETLHSKNQLLINLGIDKNGIPSFEDKAKEYGLDFSGFSTQAAFFDYDNDGDLDVFLLNHSVHENGTFRPRKDFMGTYHPLSGDRIYRNDNLVFTDVTKTTGINSTAIGYGLGIAMADVNLDGYADIYIGNDFHENDYLYINQQNGTFKEESEEQLMHTSQFSMGVDMADINNDAYPEIISVDMLAADPYILKRSLGENTYDIFNFKIKSGYSYQYTRNNLQYNRGNGLFSEVGLFSNVAATDWSWAPLWVDFDNDGLKDLFISNGIPKRLNDIDYINFISNGEIQQRISENNVQAKDISLIEKFPEIKIPDKFFKNNGNVSFSDVGNQIQNAPSGFSNGAVYADLDNDGDLDIVVNCINSPVFLYENKSEGAGQNLYAQILIKGPQTNVNGTGARVVLFTNNGIRTYEKFPVKGFMSSMEIPLHIGLKNAVVDSAFLIWPDNTYQKITINGRKLAVTYQKGLPAFDYSNLTGFYLNHTFPVQDITKESGINFLHQENSFIEFDREPLIPHMLSTEGPALAVADINGDDLDDLFIGAARDKKSAIFLQQPSGRFIRSAQPVLDRDSACEDVSACWADVNNDGFVDLIVAGGGNEFYGQDRHNVPRVYVNNGKANFMRLENAFSNIYLTASCVVPYDFNGDGFDDLFIGARTVPWAYGQVPQSYLLMNDRKGKFIDVTNSYAPGLSKIGFVTQASWYDIDRDGDEDLLLSLEWGEITAFLNAKGRFTKIKLTDKKGWWNFVLPCDIDNDGDVDLIAGNLGTNGRLKASLKEAVKLYYNDFDDNGRKEQILSYFVEGKEIPFASKAELEKQLPGLRKEFLYAGEFAKARLDELLNKEKLKNADVLTANYFLNSLLINKGNLQFEIKALPWQAQLSPLKDAVIVNANNDNLPDVLLAGNYFENNTEMGRNDADFGTLMVNKGNGSFICQQLNGFAIEGQVRHIKEINVKGKPAYILAKNNDSVKLLRFDSKK